MGVLKVWVIGPIIIIEQFWFLQEGFQWIPSSHKIRVPHNTFMISIVLVPPPHDMIWYDDDDDILALLGYIRTLTPNGK